MASRDGGPLELDYQVGDRQPCHPELAARPEETDADGWLRLKVTFQDPRHAEWVLWQPATNAEALAPQWLRTSLCNRAAVIATRYDCTRTLYGGRRGVDDARPDVREPRRDSGV